MIVCVACWRFLNPLKRLAQTSVGIAKDAECGRCGNPTRSGLSAVRRS